MSEENKAVVRRLVEEHWNNKNADIVGEIFTEDVTLDTPDGVLTGLEGASALLQAYATAFPDFHNHTDDLFAVGDQVVLRWTFEGTHRGPMAGISGSGKQAKVSRNIGVFRVNGGKVQQATLAWDKYSLFQQIGVISD